MVGMFITVSRECAANTSGPRRRSNSLAPGRTLWLDEAWTLGMAGLPDWKTTLQQVWLDANAPLYPLLIHGWAQLAGTSDTALRVPSFAFSLATPLLVAGWRGDGLRVEDRLALATLLTVWPEGLLQAGRAKPDSDNGLRRRRPPGLVPAPDAPARRSGAAAAGRQRKSKRRGRGGGGVGGGGAVGGRGGVVGGGGEGLEPVPKVVRVDEQLLESARARVRA